MDYHLQHSVFGRFEASGVAILLGLWGLRAAGGEPGEAPAAPGRHAPVAEVVFVAFDTETTGFSPEQDRIVEIGVVKFKGGKVLESRSWLVNPGQSIPYWAERVHGIRDEMVADQPAYDQVHPAFLEFIDGAVLLAHNARFDLAFIGAEARRRGLPLPKNPVLDTLPLFRTWFPGAQSYALEGLVQFLATEEGTFHRAEGDAMHIVSLVREGLSRHPEVTTLRDMEKAAGGKKGF
jgi:DNA polymerase III epsilon subunit family exonuclease